MGEKVEGFSVRSRLDPLVVRREAPSKQLNTSPCNTTAQHRHHHKRLRYCLDFCHKYSVTLTTLPSLPNFQKKPHRASKLEIPHTP